MSAAVSPPDASTRPYKGVPADQRIAERRAKLVHAGLEQFGTRGIAATRVEDVCTEAGLTKRYFYESFNSLDELALAVVDEAIGALALIVVPAVAEHGWRNPRPVFEAFASGLLADPRTIRLLVTETQHQALAAKRQQLIDLAVDLWLETDQQTDRSPEHLTTQRLLAHAMAGAAGEVALAWRNGRLDLTLHEMIDHLVRIFERITPGRRYPEKQSPLA